MVLGLTILIETRLDLQTYQKKKDLGNLTFSGTCAPSLHGLL